MAGKKNRRGAGEGNVRYREKEKLWEARLPIPGRSPRSFYARTQKEAIAKRDAAKNTFGSLTFDAEKLTVGEYLQRWLNDIQGSVREGTFDTYRSWTSQHLIPELGKVRLTKLTALHLSSLYRSKLKELKPETISSIHALLKRALKQAVRWKLIPYNPADDVDPPRGSGKEEMLFLSPGEVQLLLEAAKGHRLEALFITALRSGLRAGELAGLGWEDIDFEKRTIRVRRQVIQPRSGVRFGPPKRDSSRRIVEVREKTFEALRSHSRRQKEERLRAGPLWRNLNLVFSNPTGGMLYPGNFSATLKPLLFKAGLDGGLTFHSLRHTYATLALSSGIPVTLVSKALGHSTVTQTLDVYSHALPEDRGRVADALDDLF